MKGAVAQQTAQRDLAAELDADDGEFPESWKPRPGDKVVGVVKNYTTGETKFGPRPICVIETLNDQGVPYLLSIWLSHTVLVNEFRKVRPKVGEEIGVKRNEDGPGYARYRVLVNRPAATEPDWDSLGEPATEKPADGGSVASDTSEEIPF